MLPPSARWQAIALAGQNAWWRYLLGVVICAGLAPILGSIAAILFAIAWLTLQGRSLSNIWQGEGEMFAEASIANFIALNLPFIGVLCGLVLTLRFLHRRPWRGLVGIGPLRWQLFFSAFGLWLAIIAGVSALSYGAAPDEFELTFRWGQWLPLALVALPLTFLQVAAEELFFRGYLLQGLGLLIRSRMVLAAIAALPFALVHFANPEMQRGLGWMALYYFAFGWVANWLTLKCDRLEPALGFHLANNYFGILVVSSRDSVLPAPSIFTVDADSGSAMVMVLIFLAEVTLFCSLFFLSAALAISSRSSLS